LFGKTSAGLLDRFWVCNKFFGLCLFHYLLSQRFSQMALLLQQGLAFELGF
jgi:hypothetical protein